MFTKILIANRGEIACRIMRTARRMGIKTVAVYSDADANARHVRLADEAIWIGAAPARESYLEGGRIVTAALATGAQAIHPGYGFLSENAAFAEQCIAAGIVFIGPPASAINAMGSKSAAKTLMERANVPLTPGYHGEQQDAEFLREQAQRIGFPVLLKASSGGGGKGMRIVTESDLFSEALASCKREAAASFGDDKVLVEKYLIRPRHIEIQVFADQFGNCVSIFERDCSVQRRHQKVLEEAPAPGMAAERRAEMGRAAVDAAKAVGYVGAGTVEFIVAPDGNFYFMEMNTRLQVEHPVTEMITGLDLVEWQLRVAAGEPLPMRQGDIGICGHALEARIYAEDPSKGFLPSIGKLQHLAPPVENQNVRVDTGVEEGDVISQYYDPMICKLIVWDVDRDAALARMLAALHSFRVVGVSNNIEFLTRLVGSRSFANADLDTGLIEREGEHLLATSIDPNPEIWVLLALHEVLHDRRKNEAAIGVGSPWNINDGWRLNANGCSSITLSHDESNKRLVVEYLREAYKISVDGLEYSVTGTLDNDGNVVAVVNGKRSNAIVNMGTSYSRYVFLPESRWHFTTDEGISHDGDTAGASGALTAPMPGKISAILAEVGKKLERGAPLLVLEAMKMEHSINAPAAGTVKAFRYEVGDQVGDGDQLIDFEVTS
ncbi:acetyl-CoA carboxylase biotin carboxylase subunit [Noviherbaspirillum saxi]|uniref:Acetyl/propionyl/methylcrotonyl-CoA carboxylase subunit alpha n=1 Tax=Noviherbaspirillum saxi TaxID=2320863 RepID=A0A3A3FM32_9BURK|nr:acetyl/propionyl/methylcrotonyl-CoA carboxylase subunit alpha [Noviherbaspirillum saxi]RJF92405.1 acetyl/propionyl/methylcrotonyl-CoA carboxylase subunit alpha [Noviherbaspirillum saxi]